MAIMSKEEFYGVVKNHSCTFVHPWDPDCVQGVLKLLVPVIIGCTKFSATLSLLQIAVKGKNITREQFCSAVEHGIRLSLCGIILGLFFNIGLCSHIRFFGVNYYTVLSLPGFLGGLGIFLMRRSKRHFFISALACSVLETLINIKWRSKTRKTSPLKLTAIFMLTNSMFMYFLKLWKSNRAGHMMPELWFFAPSHHSKATNINVKDNYEEKQRRPCNHMQSCLRSIFKETSNYFCYGIAIEVFRILTANMKLFIKNPRKLIPFFFKISTLRVAAFAGLYVFLFKVTNCTLCRMYGKDRPLNSLIAGLISGTSVFVYPKDTLIITAFVNLIHVMWRYHGINQKYLKNFYTSELLFMLFCGFLSHFRPMAPDHCSRFFINLVSLATEGKSDEMYGAFKKLVIAYHTRVL